VNEIFEPVYMTEILFQVKLKNFFFITCDREFFVGLVE
jgi:hypothetical protein